MIATYPTTLPGPQPGAYELPLRRAASSLPGPLQQRSRQYDLSGGIRTHTFIYTAPQMAAWREWYRDTLLQGRRWFKLSLPGYGGMTLRTVRYLEHSQSLIGVGVYAIEARLELREANAVEPASSVVPICTDGPVWTTQSASGLGMNALGSCAFFQGYFYLFGRYTSGSTVAVFRSLTGETGSWSALTVPVNTAAVVFGARAIAGSTRMLWNFQTGGSDGTRQTLDGTTWETVIYSDVRQIHVMNTAGFERVIRSQSSARPVGMYSSTNMTAAARLVAPLGSPSFDQDQAGLSTTSWPTANTQLAFANNGNQVLALINPSSGSPTRLFISEDGGFVWTEPAISASWGSNALSVESLIHDGTRYIATSRDHNQPTHSSVDGYNWQQDSVLPVKVGQLNRALYHFDGMTYAVGLGGTGSGTQEVYGTPNPATTPWYLLPNQVGQTGGTTYHHWAYNGAGRFMAVAPGSTSMDYRLGIC